MEPNRKEAWTSFHTYDLDAVYQLLSILETATAIEQVQSPWSYYDNILLLAIIAVIFLNLLREDVYLALFPILFKNFGDLLIKPCIFFFP